MCFRQISGKFYAYLRHITLIYNSHTSLSPRLSKLRSRQGFRQQFRALGRINLVLRQCWRKVWGAWGPKFERNTLILPFNNIFIETAAFPLPDYAGVYNCLAKYFNKGINKFQTPLERGWELWNLFVLCDLELVSQGWIGFQQQPLMLDYCGTDWWDELLFNKNNL